jgi:hypothetical protein
VTKCPGCEKHVALRLVTVPDGTQMLACESCIEVLGRTGTSTCICSGCLEEIPAWWLSGMCRDCALEDCEHEEGGT